MKLHLLTLLLFSLCISYAQTNQDEFQFSVAAGYGLNIAAKVHRGGQTKTFDLNKSQIYSLNVSLGYYLSKFNTSAGIYFGLDGYDNPVINSAPIGINLRYFLFPGNKAVFVTVDFGGLIDIGSNSAKGSSFNLGVGKRLGGKKKHPYVSLNYVWKKVNFERIDPISISSVVLKLGLDF